MSLWGGIAKKLGLSWLGRQAKTARQKGSPMFKLLDGKKSLIVALGVLVSGLAQLATGHELRPMLEALLKAVGWEDQLATGLAAFAGLIVPTLWAAWAALDKIVKAWRQYRAGATPAETLTDVGHVKLAIAEGVIPRVPIDSGNA